MPQRLEGRYLPSICCLLLLLGSCKKTGRLELPDDIEAVNLVVSQEPEGEPIDASGPRKVAADKTFFLRGDLLSSSPNIVGAICSLKLRKIDDGKLITAGSSSSAPLPHSENRFRYTGELKAPKSAGIYIMQIKIKGEIVDEITIEVVDD